MSKKHLGALVAIAAAAGAAAAGISYFMKYKSFHKELEEEFHDFEDEDENSEDEDAPAERTYVSLNPDKTGEDGRETSADDKSSAKGKAEAGESGGNPPEPCAPAAEPEKTVSKDASDMKEASSSPEEASGAPRRESTTIEEAAE